MPSLYIYLNEEFRWKFTLFDKEVLIGRDHRNHVVLPQPNISRQHAVIRKTGNEFVIKDESGKGLQVNDKSVSHATLKHGDLIDIKAFRLVFKFDERNHGYDSVKGTAPCEQNVDDATLPISLPDDQTQPLFERRSIWVTAGSDKGLSCPIQGEVIRVGRSPRNHLVLKDRSVSSFHLTITPKKNGVEIEDAGSANGTYVEGHRVLHATVPMGSEIRIGKTSLTLSSSMEEQDKKDGLLGENLERIDDFVLIEKRVIERSLNAHRGDRKAVAKVMGISLSSLNDKIRRHGITK
jgi:pSer/pThr/pTyr-binding forkhead associated (FHA) protein